MENIKKKAAIFIYVIETKTQSFQLFLDRRHTLVLRTHFFAWPLENNREQLNKFVQVL